VFEKVEGVTGSEVCSRVNGVIDSDVWLSRFTSDE